MSKAQELVYNINETVNAAFLLEGVYDSGFLLVEGESDIKFWAKFVNKKYLINASGKSNVIAAADILDNKNDKKVLGVVDADFDRINSITYSNRVVLTDGHDLEILMLHSNALSQVKLEYFDEAKCQAFEIQNGKPLLDSILEHSSVFGKLRYLHIKNSCVFSFDEFNPYRYEEKSTFSFDFSKLKSDFCCQAIINITDMDECFESLSSHPKKEICQGHDTLKLMCVAHKKVCKPNSGKAIGDEDLARFLRLAFSKEDLIQTTMFQTLKQKAEDWSLTLFESTQ